MIKCMKEKLQQQKKRKSMTKSIKKPGSKRKSMIKYTRNLPMKEYGKVRMKLTDHPGDRRHI